MPKIYLAGTPVAGTPLGDQEFVVQPDSNLLDALLEHGHKVPWSCRSGHCQSCLVQARPDEAPSAARSLLSPEQQSKGWLLACQCLVQQDMHISLHDPTTDGLPARISEMRYLADDILLLRLAPERPLRFRAGQHLVLWLDASLARPYSIASLPADGELAFHLRLHAQGAFSNAIRQCQLGDRLYLGSAAGHFHYDPAWQDTPLLMLGSGTGLAPLQAIARDALLAGHEAPITVWHWSRADTPCYLTQPLLKLADQYPQLRLHLRSRAELPSDLTQLRLASRKTLALLCGPPAFIEQLRKPLFMAGLPGRQILDEAFISRQ
ncbi:2Fe-2S iron-sulfur cluster-binding protein [Halopseudomonas pelagia]|uniref:2Fe-2S iron-sulfur cluster-binding protein n=1 Tax=Halopseudomonas pelagia TaxID=553151 RepID=UPI0030D86F6D|tara:strand:+ start:12139 stop:13101 length:963 start_codon:yes stop_codon:yes gene_type:complete